MAASSLSHLNHEVRTVIHHIIGYSEILIEQGEDDDNRNVVALMQKVQAGGLKLLDYADDKINPALADYSRDDFAAFERVMRPVAEKILGSLELLTIPNSSIASSPEMLDDVASMMAACNRLLTLSQEMRTQ